MQNTGGRPQPDAPGPLLEGAGVLEVLRRRRSAKRWRPDVVDRALLESLLEVAAAAPNHHLTQPWRFVVFSGDSRLALGDVLAAVVRRARPAADTAQQAMLEDRARAKALEAPVVIAVCVVPSGAPRVREMEEVHAGAAAAENILIAAEALGLAALWRSGDAAYDHQVKAFLGVADTAHIIGFIYLGWPVPESAPAVRERTARNITDWR